jgi:hypothetical protein
MRAGARALLAGVLIIGGGSAVETSSALAQAYGPSGPLGGFGAMSGDASPGMGGSSPMIIPYGGRFEGFMPGRMGGGGPLGFQPRSTALGESSRASFRLSPMSGGMGEGFRARSRALSPFGPGGGMGLGGGMPRTRGPWPSGVMPPRIGYPFRQPPNLLNPTGPVAGMSM